MANALIARITLAIANIGAARMSRQTARKYGKRKRKRNKKQASADFPRFFLCLALRGMRKSDGTPKKIFERWFIFQKIIVGMGGRNKN